ncbi:MAG: hypothetical protein GY779_15245, partial [Gammaproteobacteria bacterium]|nr:hypothetical protein [Gammaproteobacteria bacterium]
SLDISNTDFHDVYYYGIQIGLFGAQSLTMNLDTVSFTDTGVNTSYHGIYADIDTTASLSGTWNNVTLNNIGGSGIYINDSSSGAVDPTISGLIIADTGTVGVHGVQLIGNATTTPTFDNSSGNANVISDGTYNLTLEGVGGSYANLTLDGASTSSIYISGAADPTLGWDDNSIILTNAPSPYTIQTELPGSIGLLGTADLGYNVGSSSFTGSYITLGSTSGTLTLGTSTLVVDPLNTGTNTSVYRVISHVTVGSGSTLTVEDGAIVKFNANLSMYVDGTLIVGDGDGLGANAVFTSIQDDTVGGNTNGGGASTGTRNDWNSIQARAGSVVDIDNAI